MAAGDDVRVARVRGLLERKGAVTRAQLGHALDDPIPAPPIPAPSAQWAPLATSRTGVPVGTVLTSSRTVVADKPGQVIDRLNIVGMVKVQADGVTIRRCRIKASDTAASSDYPIKLAAGVTGLVVEDTEIDGNGRTSLCVGFKGYTLRRCNVHSAAGDLLRADGGVVVEDSWLHDMVRTPGGHHDCVQTLKGSGITIRRSTLDAVTRADGTVDPMNSAYTISAGSTGGGPVADVTIEDCWLNGGNYTLYLGANDKGVPVTGVTVRGCTFGPDARYGYLSAKTAGAVLDRNRDRLGDVIH